MISEQTTAIAVILVRIVFKIISSFGHFKIEFRFPPIHLPLCQLHIILKNLLQILDRLDLIDTPTKGS